MDGTAWVAIAGIAGTTTTAVFVQWMSWWSESRKLDKTHVQEAALRTNEHRRDLVKTWRTGLAESAREYQMYEHKLQLSDNSSELLEPNAVGSEWFESLRRYLESDYLRQIIWLRCDEDLSRTISLEISRVEAEWFDPGLLHDGERGRGNDPG
ncbi:hypothetical protein R4227_22470 [Gordonia amicalis]|uniref:Uncharacterized protein n=1 Tax=Gordonia amicalis TaxID=89053 RepID=A0ABU4DKL1_9ACTN|nr:hypothetical protein [Gordonia amicalis]MDV6310287.1 hypothetical protein [Gordonia amicalis]MDV7102776.1 hypothetical protein [Gordonia amicalis]